MVTDDPLVDTLVSTLLLCSMSIVFAPLGPVLPLAVFALAPVNVTVPKLANGTRLLPSSKSSTIHSASCSHRAELDVRVLVTVSPLETFSTVAVPLVVLEALTVTVMVSPALMDIPEKSYA